MNLIVKRSKKNRQRSADALVTGRRMFLYELRNLIIHSRETFKICIAYFKWINLSTQFLYNNERRKNLYVYAHFQRRLTLISVQLTLRLFLMFRTRKRRRINSPSILSIRSPSNVKEASSRVILFPILLSNIVFISLINILIFIDIHTSLLLINEHI